MTKMLLSVAVGFIISLHSCAEVIVKGSVRVNVLPTAAECAAAYEKSDEDNLLNVLIEASGIFDSKMNDAIIGAEIELQTLPDFKVICRTKTDENGTYYMNVKDDAKDCRVYCRRKMDVSGEKLLLCGASHVKWNKMQMAYVQDLKLLREGVSLVGRCVNKDGLPIAGCVVRVDMITTPTETDEGLWPQQIGRTDESGAWRVDGLPTPTFNRQVAYMCNTNVVARFDSQRPPYEIAVYAHTRVDTSRLEGRTSVANVSEESRKAVERFLAAYMRKTHNAIPKPAPLVEFPVSTNNVIYVPDIVLK